MPLGNGETSFGKQERISASLTDDFPPSGLPRSPARDNELYRTLCAAGRWAASGGGGEGSLEFRLNGQEEE